MKSVNVKKSPFLPATESYCELLGYQKIYLEEHLTTALIAYWYQAKNECVSVGGWIILFAYYSSMIFNRSVLGLYSSQCRSKVVLNQGFDKDKG